MSINVKPLTHWIIYKGYKVRFTRREPTAVTGVLTTPQGEINFRYDPTQYTIYLADERIIINEYGWEVRGSEQ